MRASETPACRTRRRYQGRRQRERKRKPFCLRLFFPFLLDANRAVGGDFVVEVSGGDQLWNRRILLQHVQDVAVLGGVAQDVGVNAGSGFPAPGGRCLDDGLVHLALFKNFPSVARNEVAQIAAQRIKAGLLLCGIKVDIELTVARWENGGVVGTPRAAKIGERDLEGAGRKQVKARVFLGRVDMAYAEDVRLTALNGFVADEEF